MDELLGRLAGGGAVVELFTTKAGDEQLRLTASLSLAGMLDAVQIIPGFEIVRGTKEGDASGTGFLLCKPVITRKKVPTYLW